jgi:hypothetical protein
LCRDFVADLLRRCLGTVHDVSPLDECHAPRTLGVISTGKRKLRARDAMTPARSPWGLETADGAVIDARLKGMLGEAQVRQRVVRVTEALPALHAPQDLILEPAGLGPFRATQQAHRSDCIERTPS